MIDSNILVNMSLTPSKYNDEPVHYCTQCLSLNIKIMGDTNYCDDCGGTDTSQAHIEDWQELYSIIHGQNKTIKK